MSPISLWTINLLGSNLHLHGESITQAAKMQGKTFFCTESYALHRPRVLKCLYT